MSFRQTAVFPINEEFYIGLMQRLKKTKLNPTYVSACKHQFPKPYEWHQLPSKPYEQFERGPIKRLAYRYVFDPKKPNTTFDFEEQAKHDMERGFDYVPLSQVEIPFDINPKKCPILVRFQRKQVTRGSRTQRSFSKFLLNLAKSYGLYQNMPAREFQKWRNNIYCLEATHVIEYMANSPIKPRDVTATKLNDSDFLRILNIKTKGIVQVCAKVLEKQGNWVFDGLVTELGFEEG